MMLVTVYGIGGHDPAKPNENILSQYDDGRPDTPVTVPIEVDPQALADAQDKVASAASLDELRSATLDALALLNTTST